MAFKLDILKKDEKFSVKRDIEFDGLEMTLQIQSSKEFEQVAAEVAYVANKPRKLTKDSLKRGNQDEIGAHEAMLFVIGEYCISKWNVIVNDEPLAINGDNFLALLDQGFEKDKLNEFLTVIFNAYKELGEEFRAAKDEMVKKSLTGTSGKKSAQRSRQTESKAIDD